MCILTDAVDNVRCLCDPDWLLHGDGDADLGQGQIRPESHGQGRHRHRVVVVVTVNMLVIHFVAPTVRT